MLDAVTSLERRDPDRIETPDGRYYRTDDGIFPSVTTVLKHTVPKEDAERLAAWAERVGPDEVAKVEIIRDEGAARGSALHAAVEAWVEDPFSDGPAPNDDPWWNSIVPFLAKTLVQPLAYEGAVWHGELGYAGTFDMVAIVRPGCLALIDWKSARKQKKRRWIGDFVLQAAAYVYALRWLDGVVIEHAIIVVAYEKDPADVFWIDARDLAQAWLDFQKRLREFQRQEHQCPESPAT
jgi:genome maintenance exonuclease 1